jgi:hypothetical protein
MVIGHGAWRKGLRIKEKKNHIFLTLCALRLALCFWVSLMTQNLRALNLARFTELSNI